MARKKKITLEQEFEARKKAHKSFIVMYTLIKSEGKAFNNKNLKHYKNFDLEPFMEDYEGYSTLQTRAMVTTTDLETRAENGEQELYDTIYEYCWKKARKTLCDTDTPEQHGMTE